MEILAYIGIALNAILLILVILLFARDRGGRKQRETQQAIATLRAEITAEFRSVAELARLSQAQAGSLTQTVDARLLGNEERIERLRSTIDLHLQRLAADNAQKLDAMRHSVDVRLQETLDKRLSESFKSVSERLEQVHKGLGEMQQLASGVGDLQRLFTGVKTRGIWGEVSLGSLLEEMLTPDQYLQNAAILPRSAERVEFAIRLPGDGTAPVLLPIDAKFPTVSYLALIDAQQAGDKATVDAAGRALEDDIKAQARRIRDKYIAPPHSTNFAVMYLPAEGLYAEVLRRPGMLEWTQRECRVTIAGPTTLAALLNSLQLGFRTLAIQKRSGEVWRLLAQVKRSFELFIKDLGRAKNQLDTLSNTLDSVTSRSSTIRSRLDQVEALPSEEDAAPPADDESLDARGGGGL